jgi:hypothetical protein
MCSGQSLPKFDVGKLKELHEMYRPGVEITNLAFASDIVVLLSWKISADERVPNLNHTNETIGAYFYAGARICMDITTGCKRM